MWRRNGLLALHNVHRYGISMKYTLWIYRSTCWIAHGDADIVIVKFDSEPQILLSSSQYLIMKVETILFDKLSSTYETPTCQKNQKHLSHNQDWVISIELQSNSNHVKRPSVQRVLNKQTLSNINKWLLLVREGLVDVNLEWTRFLNMEEYWKKQCIRVPTKTLIEHNKTLSVVTEQEAEVSERGTLRGEWKRGQRIRFCSWTCDTLSA